MPLYRLSIIPAGEERSQWHGERTAPCPEAAVAAYINSAPTDSQGARVAQTRGGVVLVGEVGGSQPYGSVPVYGLRLFRVAPTVPPPPPERATIVGPVVG